MAYVRAKKIKGNTYYYLVKSVREGSRVRQVVVDYLGTERPVVKSSQKAKKNNPETG